MVYLNVTWTDVYSCLYLAYQNDCFALNISRYTIGYLYDMQVAQDSTEMR